MTIDTVIFDFGGVLYNTPELKYLLRWQKILGITNDPEVTMLINDPGNSQLFWDVMIGRVKEAELWNLLAKQWHIPPRLYSKFQNNMMSKRRMNKPLVKLLRSINVHFKTAILSNAGDQTRVTMENVFGFHKLVDEIIISAEEGVAKPDKALYTVALDKLGSQPECCIFIDDLLENIETASAMGMNVIHHTANNITIKVLSDKLGLET